MYELSLPAPMREHLSMHPGTLDYTLEIEEGVYYHAMRDTAWNSGSMHLTEAAIDCAGLAQACKAPAIGTFLGKLGLQAINADRELSCQLARYPNVEQLTLAVDALREEVPLYSPPDFTSFTGGIYSAEQFLEGLVSGRVLISDQKYLEHDMVQHAPAWLSIPPHIFTAVRRYAENALQNPGEPDKYGRTKVGRFMDDIDITFGVSPAIGKLMVDPTRIPIADSTTALVMQKVVGPDGSGQAALREIADYALFISTEIRN